MRQMPIFPTKSLIKPRLKSPFDCFLHFDGYKFDVEDGIHALELGMLYDVEQCVMIA